MAKLIAPNGTITDVHPKGKHFSLEELRTLIDCHLVQVVYLLDNQMMWLDEEGKLKENPQHNSIATRLLHQAGGIPGDFVVGNALVTKHNEVE